VLDTSTSFGLRRADLTIGDPDLGTPVDQLGRQCCADAGRAAGNECNLPRHVRCHCERIIARPRRSHEILAAGSPRCPWLGTCRLRAASE
jgi:hypothetical protein